MSTEVKCYWAVSPRAPLSPSTITRRACGENDVVIKILYAGICHSDIHQARNEWREVWGDAIFPMVPGHEVVGEAVEVGSRVTKVSVGQRVGVGCMVDSCRNCSSCKRDLEQYCQFGAVGTYNSKHKYRHCVEYNEEGGTPTYGGYSQMMVVDANYVLTVPHNLDVRGVAPLLCAGITTYSPLIEFQLRPYHKFAVAGLGGLGHMAVKFGVAFGAHTTVLSRGTGKRDSALTELKADAYIDVTDAEAVKAAAKTFDFILSTISADHNVDLYVNMLKNDGKIVMVGAPDRQLKFYPHALLGARRIMAGSMIGGIKETQDMLDFCGRKNIVSDVEVIPASAINEAYERTLKADVKYRFVIDVSTM